MSIKSDKWIKRMCAEPTHVLEYEDRNVLWTPSSPAAMTLAELGSGAKNIRQSVPEDMVDWKPMIEPFVPKLVRNINDSDIDLTERAISFGVSSYGYDVRVADEFKIFTNINNQVIDPKNFNDKIFVDHKGPTCIIPPNSFALARTVEYFRIPRNVLTICLGKSTYARCGIIVNVTPLEPEWEGHVVLEFSNTTTLPAIIYANEGVAQFLFFESDEECEVSYKDRGGKYMGQTGITLPKA